MLREFLRLSFSLVLILLCLPLLVLSFLVAGLCTTAAAIFPPLRRKQDDALHLDTLTKTDEFGFEGALHAYEELIGMHAWRKS